MLQILTITIQLIAACLLSMSLLWLNRKVYQTLYKMPKLNEHHFKIKKTYSTIRLLILGISFVGGILVLSFNLWLIYRGIEIYEYFLSLSQKFSRQQFIDLGIIIGKILILLICVSYINNKIPILVKKISIFLQNIDNLSDNDQSIEDLFSLLTKTITSGLWFLTIVICLNFFPVSKNIYLYSYLFLRIYLILSIALLINKSPLIIIDTIKAFAQKYIDRYPEEYYLKKIYQKVNKIIPFTVKIIEVLVVAIAVTLSISQIEAIANWSIWGHKIIQVIGVIFVAKISIELIHLLIDEIFSNKNNSPRKVTEQDHKIYSTLIPLVKSVFTYLIIFGAIIAMLYVFGINPLPLLAGAGLIGFGVSMAAQDSIRDLICGFFIILENHFMVGDYVQIGSAEGYVQSLEFRITVIKHPLGHQYILRNGSINTVVNYSKETGIYIDTDLDIPDHIQISEVYNLIDILSQNLQNEYPDIREGLKITAINRSNDSNTLIVKVQSKIIPGKHEILRETIGDYLQEQINRNIC